MAAAGTKRRSIPVTDIPAEMEAIQARIKETEKEIAAQQKKAAKRTRKKTSEPEGEPLGIMESPEETARKTQEMMSIAASLPASLTEEAVAAQAGAMSAGAEGRDFCFNLDEWETMKLALAERKSWNKKSINRYQKLKNQAKEYKSNKEKPLLQDVATYVSMIELLEREGKEIQHLIDYITSQDPKTFLCSEPEMKTIRGMTPNDIKAERADRNRWDSYIAAESAGTNK